MRTSRTLRCLGLAAASGAFFVGTSVPAEAQVLQKDQVLDGDTNGKNFISVDIGGQSGERKLLVAGNIGTSGTSNQFVRLYQYSDELTGWTFEEHFPPGPLAGYAFGVHCEVHRVGHKRNDIVAIASPNSGSSGGNVFVYRRGSLGLWPERNIASVDHGGWPGDWFGASIALDYPLLLVGATSRHSSAGGATLFIHHKSTDSWNKVRDFTGVMGGDDRFGCSVAICGGDALDARIAIGAERADSSDLTDSGAVYVYRRTATGWEDERLLVSPQAGGHRFFGKAVSLSQGDLGTVLVVGEPSADVYNPGEEGAAYIFRSAADSPDYVEEQRLEPAVLTADARFGWSVDTDGRYAVVSAPYPFSGGDDAIYLYENDQDVPGTWTLVQETAGTKPSADFGYDVALLDHGPGDEPETALAVTGGSDGAGVSTLVPTDLQMEVSPHYASLSDTVTMEVTGGHASGRLMIVAWEIDNTPFFYNIFGIQGFDAAGEWSFSSALPPLPVGTELEFRTFGQCVALGGKMGVSNRGHLVITP